jgi:hypothetical protein
MVNLLLVDEIAARVVFGIGVRRGVTLVSMIGTRPSFGQLSSFRWRPILWVVEGGHAHAHTRVQARTVTTRS